MNRRLPVLVLLVIALSACRRGVDPTTVLEAQDIVTGWFDAGIVNGQNKLVPSVTFKLKKQPGTKLSSVSLNLTFSFIGTQDSNEDVYVQSVPFEATETKPITVRTQWGYTGDPPQTRAEMLKNSQFRDMEVSIFAKQSSSQWVELQRVPVTRQLLTQ